MDGTVVILRSPEFCFRAKQSADCALHCMHSEASLIAARHHTPALGDRRYIDAALGTEETEPQQVLAAGLYFDAREALVLAQRCGMKKAARKLLLLRGDFSAALALSEDVETVSKCVAQAPSAAHRDLWLQFAQRRAIDKAGIAELHSVVKASVDCVSPEDLLPFIPEGGPETIHQVAQLVGKHLHEESTKLGLLDKQFEGLGDRMASRRKALQDLQQRDKQVHTALAASSCAACGNLLSRKPKHGRSLGAFAVHL